MKFFISISFKKKRIETIFCVLNCGVTWCKTHFNSLFHHHNSYILFMCECASILPLKFCNNSCCIKILLTLKFEIHPEYMIRPCMERVKTFKRFFCSIRTCISSACVGQIPLYMVLNNIIADSHVFKIFEANFSKNSHFLIT